MLSGIPPQKDSTQSFKERLKSLRDSTLPSTSPLAQSSSVDIVTNDDRAKPPEVIRVLSPMRPRRTPVLVNAPDVRWRLAQWPYLCHIPSLDSVMSSSASSGTSTALRVTPAPPHNVASPAVTAMLQGTDLSAIPLPPSPPPQMDARFSEPVYQPRTARALCFHQPHFLSPVTEASSAPSMCSSITDLNIQDIGTAELRRVGSIGPQDVIIIDGASCVTLTSQQRRWSRSWQQCSLNSAEPFSESPRSAICNNTPVGNNANGPREEEAAPSPEGNPEDEARKRETKRKGLSASMAKLSNNIKRYGNKVVKGVARKLIARVLAHVL